MGLHADPLLADLGDKLLVCVRMTDGNIITVMATHVVLDPFDSVLQEMSVA
jgi:hypothetical protein